MANNKPATPAQILAREYNFKVRQLKGMQRVLANMREPLDSMEADICNIWADHCRNGVAELESRLKDVRKLRIAKAKEKASGN